MLLRKRANDNHKAFLISVANVIRTHHEISAADLALKIGLSVQKTEIIIGEISATDNGFTLRYNTESQTYKMVPTGTPMVLMNPIWDATSLIGLSS